VFDLQSEISYNINGFREKAMILLGSLKAKALNTDDAD